MFLLINLQCFDASCNYQTIPASLPYQRQAGMSREVGQKLITEAMAANLCLMFAPFLFLLLAPPHPLKVVNVQRGRDSMEFKELSIRLCSLS